MNQIKIKNHIIENFHSPFIISEAGLNHNGELEKAFKMIELAKEAGSDAIKCEFCYKRKTCFGISDNEEIL